MGICLHSPGADKVQNISEPKQNKKSEEQPCFHMVQMSLTNWVREQCCHLLSQNGSADCYLDRWQSSKPPLLFFCRCRQKKLYMLAWTNANHLKRHRNEWIHIQNTLFLTFPSWQQSCQSENTAKTGLTSQSICSECSFWGHSFIWVCLGWPFCHVLSSENDITVLGTQLTTNHGSASENSWASRRILFEHLKQIWIMD